MQNLSNCPPQQIITYPDDIILNVTQSKATFIIQRCRKANKTSKSRSPGWSQSIPLSYTQLERLPICLQKTTWRCPQPCSFFSSPLPLYLVNHNKGTGHPEGQGRVNQWKEGSLLLGINTDNKDHTAFKAIQSVRRAIHWVPAILEIWTPQSVEELVKPGQPKNLMSMNILRRESIITVGTPF